MTPMVDGKAQVIDFPIVSHEESKALAADLIKDIGPSTLIAIERCGLTSDGDYLNFKRFSIAEYNAKLDYLFHDFPHTVGIGDGGNEIGMGNCADVIPNYDRLSVPAVRDHDVAPRHLKRLELGRVRLRGLAVNAQRKEPPPVHRGGPGAHTEDGRPRRRGTAWRTPRSTRSTASPSMRTRRRFRCCTIIWQNGA